MKKTRRQLVEHYCSQIASGKIEFSDVRKSLETERYSEEDISVILERIDRDLDRMAIVKAEKHQGRQMLYLGLFVMLIGIFITVGTYTGIIDFGNNYIIAYGPALGGLGLALVGAVKMNR